MCVFAGRGSRSGARGRFLWPRWPWPRRRRRGRRRAGPRSRPRALSWQNGARGGRGRPSPASPALQLASCLSPLDHAPSSGDNAFTEDSGQWGASALLTPAACSRPPCRLRPPPPGQVAVPTSQAVDSLCGLPLRETAFGPGALRTIRVPRRQTRLGLREAGVVATPGRLRLRRRESGGRGPSGWSHNTQVHTWLRHGPDAGTQLAARGDTPRRVCEPPGPPLLGAPCSQSVPSRELKPTRPRGRRGATGTGPPGVLRGANGNLSPVLSVFQASCSSARLKLQSAGTSVAKALISASSDDPRSRGHPRGVRHEAGAGERPRTQGLTCSPAPWARSAEVTLRGVGAGSSPQGQRSLLTGTGRGGHRETSQCMCQKVTYNDKPFPGTFSCRVSRPEFQEMARIRNSA